MKQPHERALPDRIPLAGTGLTPVAGPGAVITPTAHAALAEALAIAPEGYGVGNLEMLPTTPHRGACRICGQVTDLTREHIPPQSAGNKGQYRSFTFQDWLDRADGQLDLGKGDPGQGGVWGYTLCKPCNDLTGQRYVPEYKAWAIRAAQLLTQAPPPRETDLKPEPFGLTFGFGGEEDGGVAPGDFIREVLSLMCSLGGSWELTHRYPALRRMILDRECAPMPDRMRVYLSICWGPRSRLIGPQLVLDPNKGQWRGSWR